MYVTEPTCPRFRLGERIAVTHKSINAEEFVTRIDSSNVAFLKKQVVKARNDREFLSWWIDFAHLRVRREGVNLAVIWSLRQIGLFARGFWYLSTVDRMKAEFGFYDPYGAISEDLKPTGYPRNPHFSQIRLIDPGFHNPGALRICCNVGALLRRTSLNQSGYRNDERNDCQDNVYDKTNQRIIWVVLRGYLIFLMGYSIALCDVLFFHFFRRHSGLRLSLWAVGLSVMVGGLGSGLLLHWRVYQQQRQHSEHCNLPHSKEIVSQKDLTTITLCNTVSVMANVLNADKQTAIIAALAEGSSIRSIERITGVHRDTIMRLGVKVGQGCTALLDEKMRNLPCRLLQFDEVWGFIGKKERHVRPDDDPQYGNVWTFCAIDAETKLVPSFKCGKRDLATAKTFVADVQSRMAGRVQISSDALKAYQDAIEQTFGADVDFGQIIKTYEHDESQNAERKYSAAKFVSVEKRSVTGSPDMDLVSTSYIERLNATTRLHMRRLTRLTLAFSKKLENFEAAVGLHFAYYNLVKRHGSLRCTPAMAAGVERDFWSVAALVEAAS